MVSSVTQEVSARANETLEDSDKNSVVVEEVTETIFEINKKAKQLNEWFWFNESFDKKLPFCLKNVGI